MGGGSTGLRTSKQDASGTTAFLWDGERLLAESAGGSTVAQYTAGPGSYGPMLSQRRGATSSFYHPSVQGTVETLTDASGNVTDSYVMTAFGVPVATTGSTANPHRYIGALGYNTDPTIGLDYVRARYLRPATGSWLSVDPVPSEPRYQYVGGRVTGAVDASGMGWPANWLHYLDCYKEWLGCAGSLVITVCGVVGTGGAALVIVIGGSGLILAEQCYEVARVCGDIIKASFKTAYRIGTEIGQRIDPPPPPPPPPPPHRPLRPADRMDTADRMSAPSD